MKSKLLVLEGLAMRSAQGEQHQAGIVAWLTGSVQDRSPRGYSLFPSIDQLIATRISRGKKPKASLQMAIRWATGSSKGLLSPINCANYEDNPSGRHIKFSDALGENSHSHSNLLVSILNLFGDERTVCGDPEYCAGPLAQLV